VEARRAAFRFVHPSSMEDPALADDFKSDKEAGLRPGGRERQIPELCQGISMYGSLASARQVWSNLRQIADERGQKVRVGYYIAEVVLMPGNDFEIEDLGEPDEHLIVWGDRFKLCDAVGEVYDAQTEGG
jgi:hypothetical protein